MMTIEDLDRIANAADLRNEIEWELVHPATYVSLAIAELDWALKCMRTSPWQYKLHSSARDAVMTALDLLHKVKK